MMTAPSLRDVEVRRRPLLVVRAGVDADLLVAGELRLAEARGPDVAPIDGAAALMAPSLAAVPCLARDLLVARVGHGCGVYAR